MQHLRCAECGHDLTQHVFFPAEYGDPPCSWRDDSQPYRDHRDDCPCRGYQAPRLFTYAELLEILRASHPPVPAPSGRRHAAPEAPPAERI